MKISELLAAATKPTFSLEILPAVGLTPAESLKRYESLLELQPIFADFPYHAKRNLDTFSASNDSVLKAVPTAEELSLELLKNYQITPMVHLLCKGFTENETEKALLKLQEIGVENVLLLRGDISEKKDLPGHKFAYQLVEQVRNLNEGILLSGEKIAFEKQFCMAVGGYPEPTAENSDLSLSIQHLKQKVEARADFIITQLFFDNERFFAFEKACRDAGISVPILPGICPITTANLIKKLPHFFQVSLPKELQNEIANSPAELLPEIGVQWAIKQARELLTSGVKHIHFFSMAKPKYIQEVVAQVFK